MATQIPARPRFSGPKSVRVTIIASEYNNKLVQALLENTTEELEAIYPRIKIETIRVPGAFEIPVALEHYLENVNEKLTPHAIITLGVIIRGKTAHGDNVANSVTQALQDQSIRHQLPVVNEVLIVDDKKQAFARCVSAKLNRGIEAARTAMKMIQLFHKLNNNTGKASMRMHPSQV